MPAARAWRSARTGPPYRPAPPPAAHAGTAPATPQCEQCAEIGGQRNGHRAKRRQRHGHQHQRPPPDGIRQRPVDQQRQPEGQCADRRAQGRLQLGHAEPERAAAATTAAAYTDWRRSEWSLDSAPAWRASRRSAGFNHACRQAVQRSVKATTGTWSHRIQPCGRQARCRHKNCGICKLESCGISPRRTAWDTCSAQSHPWCR